MVFIRRKSIEQLRKEIAEQKKRISGEKLFSTKISERAKLRKQLFELRNRKLIEAGKKAKRLSSRFRRGLLIAGKKAAPILQKQKKKSKKKSRKRVRRKKRR